MSWNHNNVVVVVKIEFGSASQEILIWSMRIRIVSKSFMSTIRSRPHSDPNLCQKFSWCRPWVYIKNVHFPHFKLSLSANNPDVSQGDENLNGNPQSNKLVVFLAAVSALFLMTILSGLLGWVATQFIPRSSSSVQNSLLLTILSGLLGWVATQFIPRSSS